VKENREGRRVKEDGILKRGKRQRKIGKEEG